MVNGKEKEQIVTLLAIHEARVFAFKWQSSTGDISSVALMRVDVLREAEELTNSSRRPSEVRYAH